ncbi:MAG: ATP-binding protein [Lachnospiraceae bacterium]|nr:ATP-binding protein [Lachnospiraceae bacterium]
MSDTVVLGKSPQSSIVVQQEAASTESFRNAVPEYGVLESDVMVASRLVDDLVLKKYLRNLSELEVKPLDDSLKKISDIRIFKITEMVYQNNEYSTYKFASVFNSVQNLNCGVYIIADSDGRKTDFYMGVRSFDSKRTTKSLKDTLRNALIGQFPGVKTQDLLDPVAERLLNGFATKNIAAVSCVANNKDEDFKDNATFIQGLEKLALAMQGQKYTAIVLAKSTPIEQLEVVRQAYEGIYTQLSPFASMQLSYGTNMALSVSDALSHGMTTGKSYSKNMSMQTGSSYSKGTAENHSVSKADTFSTLAKSIGSVALGVASLATAPLTGGASIAAAAAITLGQVGLSAVQPKTYADGTSVSETYSENRSVTEGEMYGTNVNRTDSFSRTSGITEGSSNNIQLTRQNKALTGILNKIDLQLKRIEECESIGMWECAAYFLSDTQETAEMAAGTYKSLMRGAKSGIETSAINFWNRKDVKELAMIREYIINFVHPIFEYRSEAISVPVTAASLVSGNELAILMGLPRNSICGFPVIEHADFGKEIVRYSQDKPDRVFSLGMVYVMGKETDTKVEIDCDSLTMHTFVTGATGSGKSNTVYEILSQLRRQYDIPFLVIEPAKGEYKRFFGHYSDVYVFGTNPAFTQLLQINPFRFPDGIHVLEHVDRLIEIFNVCWPMYAAMPAVLKAAVLAAYESCGWDMTLSINSIAASLYPTFQDLLEQLEKVISESDYSEEVKSNYKGSLATRVQSLTNGLNGQIFTSDEIENEVLFDSSVVVDLSRVGSQETKSLLMGILVMKLVEYRMVTCTETNQKLNHITVLEEAHNILKIQTSGSATDGGDVTGKSVEMLSNAIAEMRTYGEGFIIADQSPKAVDISAIRNTNTKIIMRLPEESDRMLSGKAAAMRDSQLDEIVKLPKGVAVVYQNDWVEPVLCKIDKFKGIENNYCISAAVPEVMQVEKKAVSLLVNMVIRNRLDNPSILSFEQITWAIGKCGCSARTKMTLYCLLNELKLTGELSLWNRENFLVQSDLVRDILGLEDAVLNVREAANDFISFDCHLNTLVARKLEYPTDDILLSVKHCLMKSYSNIDENGLECYRIWHNEITQRRGLV